MLIPSFVIIKGEEGDEHLNQLLLAIEKLTEDCSPCEIIVVGPSSIDLPKFVQHFVFDDEYPSTWITRKKNMGVALSASEFVVVQHLDMLPHPTFLGSLSTIDLDWDYCTFRSTHLTDGYRTYTWNDLNNEVSLSQREEQLPGPNTYISGGVCMLKKSSWKQWPWDEKLHWNQMEDVELSYRMLRSGGRMKYFPQVPYFCRNGQ